MTFFRMKCLKLGVKSDEYSNTKVVGCPGLYCGGINSSYPKSIFS
jgi:hypothetical protein